MPRCISVRDQDYLAHRTTRVLTVERLTRVVFPSFRVPSSFFEGLFWRCDDPDFPPGVHRDACGVDAASGAPNCYLWVNAPMLHYDSIGHALLSTFVISSGGWEGLLADALAMTELDHQPREKNSIWTAPYFLLGVFSFGFFLKNLFIGVLQSTYLRHRSLEFTSAHGLECSNEDRRWGEFEKMLREQRPQRVVGLGATAAVGSARRALWGLSTFQSFESAVTALLIANALLLCTQHAGEPATLVTTRDVAEVRAPLLARRSSAVVLFLSSAVLHLLLGRPPRRARPLQTEFEKRQHRGKPRLII